MIMNARKKEGRRVYLHPRMSRKRPVERVDKEKEKVFPGGGPPFFEKKKGVQNDKSGWSTDNSRK